MKLIWKYLSLIACASLSLAAVLFCGCGDVIHDDFQRVEVAPITGALPLELTPELRAQGVIAVEAFRGPWVFRRDAEGRLHEGDLIQIEVFGVAGLSRRYLEYVNSEGYWVPRGVKPVKCRKRTQQNVTEDFPSRAHIPETPGLMIQVYGPYSTDCYLVNGEVKRWGFYPWKEGTTVRDAIQNAQGVRREMPQGRLELVRGDRKVSFDLKAVLAGTTKPFSVKPMDAIGVSEFIDMKFDARKLGVPPPPPAER